MWSILILMLLLVSVQRVAKWNTEVSSRFMKKSECSVKLFETERGWERSCRTNAQGRQLTPLRVDCEVICLKLRTFCLSVWLSMTPRVSEASLKTRGVIHCITHALKHQHLQSYPLHCPCFDAYTVTELFIALFMLWKASAFKELFIALSHSLFNSLALNEVPRFYLNPNSHYRPAQSNAGLSDIFQDLQAEPDHPYS